MATFHVTTATEQYPVVVERGVLARTGEFVPANAGRLFIATTEDVWLLHGDKLVAGLAGRPFTKLLFPGGEARKRLASLEQMAEQMVREGADRSSVVIALGGGIVTDVSGFLAAIFMRGVPVIQIPTTLLAQVDAAVGGKTGVNLASGKNLLGSFHQPRAVLIDPVVLPTLPEREYRAGLYEVLKHGVIRSEELFQMMEQRAEAVLQKQPEVVDYLVEESVRIKAEVVSADEKEADLRRILNFGHTVGHALEAETEYIRLLHGEAVAFGMRAATYLAVMAGLLPEAEAARIDRTIRQYGPLPSLAGVTAAALVSRLKSDKKTVRGSVHFVLPEAVGRVRIVKDLDEAIVTRAVEAALAESRASAA